MTVFTIDYDNFHIERHEYEGIANLDAFTREMDELYGEWYDNYADAYASLVADTDRMFIEYAGIHIDDAKQLCIRENLDFNEEFWEPFLNFLNL